MPKTIALIPYSTRFAQALGVLCTETPDVAMCIAWLDGESEDLQDWTCDHLRLEWAQGIETIDAARAIANGCEEGRPELLSYDEERAARVLTAGPVQLKKAKRGSRSSSVVADCPQGILSEGFLSLMREDFAVRDSESRLHLASDVELAT